MLSSGEMRIATGLCFGYTKRMSENNQNALLPSGFMDGLPPDSSAEADAIHTLMALYQGNGYARVKPPLLEFETSLLGIGPGKALADDTFRVMDPLSHKMLGLRSDVTPQITRIARSRLDGTASPLRLCYAADVVRIRATQTRLARQFTQVGAEIIGDDSFNAQIEVAVLSVLGLKQIGVKNVTIDLNIPCLLDVMFDVYKADDETRAQYIKALQKRDRDFFGKCKGALAKAIFTLLDMDLDIAQTLAYLKTLKGKDIKGLCKNLEVIYQGIDDAFMALGFDDVAITLDVFEEKGFDYYSGVAFTLFADGVSGELGRGGQYYINDNECPQNMAQGFTLYMDTIRSVYENKPAEKWICVKADESWEQSEKLRASGWMIWRGDAKNAPEKCTHLYKNNEIKEL